MLFPKNIQNIESVFLALLEGPTNVAQLKDRMEKSEIVLSLSSIYKYISILRDSGIVIKQKGIYEVSNEWRKRASHLLSQTHLYIPHEGEKIVHTLNSVADGDILWKQYVFGMIDQETIQDFYFYEAHLLWINEPKRTESELAFIDYAKNNNLHVYHTLGYTTLIDEILGKSIRGGSYQVNFEHLSQFSDSSHISVINDIFIDTKINKSLTEEMHKLYLVSTSIENLKQEMEKLFTVPQRSTFTIERNAKKTAELKRRMGRNFAKKQIKN